MITYTITVDEAIYPFPPGTTVLVRNAPTDKWSRTTFLYKQPGDIRPFRGNLARGFAQCILYEGNEHLLGTVNSHTPLKPLQPVLVGDFEKTCWKLDLFSHYMPNRTCPYRCVAHDWRICIPYEGNEHLLGTVCTEITQGE